MQNTATQNYRGSAVFHNTRPGNEVGLFYNAAETTPSLNSTTAPTHSCIRCSLNSCTATTAKQVS